jgi:membrane-associated phospholipid phosphatase
MSADTHSHSTTASKDWADTRRKHSGWFLPPLIAALWRQFRAQCRALPRAAWQTWSLTLAIGAVVNALLALGITFFVRAQVEQGGLQAWDERALRTVAFDWPFTFNNGIIWQSPGSLPYLVPLVWLFVAFTIWRGRLMLALSMLSIYYLGHLFVFIGWGMWNRERPTLVADGIAAPPLHSFPSGHVATTISIYGFLTYLWMRASGSWIERIIALVLCTALVSVVALARLVDGVHWPSDVFAGFVIGFAWLLTTIIALRRAEAKQ